ncbi:hypothetical protein OOU_Y34scaffold00666g69 [Pyricularia oryzae Y34]|uniref:Uncharacterized protein n=2 Tax=Pyricularia oryzae TaxID=318829 RepID=A0AA97NTT3_PYRO3|nr:hypothetical protein OOU_Y34scaffold00666g69 [Pyricularia oryzae Y34]
MAGEPGAVELASYTQSESILAYAQELSKQPKPKLQPSMVAINTAVVRTYLESRSPLPKGGGGSSGGSRSSSSRSSSSKSWSSNNNRANRGYYGGGVAGGSGGGGGTLPVWAIVLIVVGVFVAILLIVICIGRHKKKRNERNEQLREENEALRGIPSSPVAGDSYTHADDDGYRNDAAAAPSMSHRNSDPDSIMLLQPASVALASNADYYAPPPPSYAAATKNKPQS